LTASSREAALSCACRLFGRSFYERLQTSVPSVTEITKIYLKCPGEASFALRRLTMLKHLMGQL
jgi:hypothetical protein